ncbi:helix-turn-helix domain-containing protein [Heyndrickxia sporothermodurans]
MGKDREMPRTFGQKLRHFRNLRGYSCKELGTLAKIDQGYINRMELGKRRAPSYPIIKNLCTALKIDVTDLIDIEQSEEELPVKSIQEVLVFHEYLINGKLPGMEARENLLALMQTLLDCEWEENKHIETVKITEKVNQFLNSLKQ